jgi:hypothetical protein
MHVAETVPAHIFDEVDLRRHSEPPRVNADTISLDPVSH